MEFDMDFNKQFLVVKANLISQGLFEETWEGIQITAKGKILARKKWIELPDEDKLLYSWLLRSLYDMGRL